MTAMYCHLVSVCLPPNTVASLGILICKPQQLNYDPTMHYSQVTWYVLAAFNLVVAGKVLKSGESTHAVTALSVNLSARSMPL